MVIPSEARNLLSPFRHSRRLSPTFVIGDLIGNPESFSSASPFVRIAWNRTLDSRVRGNDRRRRRKLSTND